MTLILQLKAGFFWMNFTDSNSIRTRWLKHVLSYRIVIISFWIFHINIETFSIECLIRKSNVITIFSHFAGFHITKYALTILIKKNISELLSLQIKHFFSIFIIFINNNKNSDGSWFGKVYKESICRWSVKLFVQHSSRNSSLIKISIQ